jgi:hypothetical protein
MPKQAVPRPPLILGGNSHPNMRMCMTRNLLLLEGTIPEGRVIAGVKKVYGAEPFLMAIMS